MIGKRRIAVLLTLVVASSIVAIAQQDSTVEWRLSLQDLDRRLSTVSSDAAPMEAWRTDAEALRASLVFFTVTHADIHVDVPPPLSEQATGEALRTQLDKLNAAVD